MKYHEPVLKDEIIDYLLIKPKGVYLDMTLGGGGHSIEILKNLSEDGLLIGVDQDKEAIKYANNRFKDFDNYILFNENFVSDKLWGKLKKHGNFDGIIFDLGVSTHQLKKADRGFSFQKDGPLDMRMSKNIDMTAEYVVNKYDQKDLADIIYKYGEERNSRRIAKKIVRNRPIKTTRELADIIRSCFSHKQKRRMKIDVATRTFQALRIYINQELEILEKALDRSISNLKKGGRLEVITYHSLEDREVKKKFKREAKDCICPPEIPICKCDHKAKIKWINKSVIRPGEEEMKENPSSRSAKLRVVERI
ncbi:MAG: 16S rRNA (cytosine(1402)-N(4))-methyltransferase RsmH [Candidatus Mcinerneyibacterium aminivorans]|uniref:Ribosomal RNA small subunit methyltransferase H n=1 Tax=Candidatus Mcinerneyibacterium aminivorans TaxID=2703815 RepID=A0A5D0MFJ8_9BACT|nr:MAG: 16S rRNA (cytosine(1402)-N(4))-methyltransferase RsmH [Candidatus Mcinerneyibacterium aminivorans]